MRKAFELIHVLLTGNYQYIFIHIHIIYIYHSYIHYIHVQFNSIVDFMMVMIPVEPMFDKKAFERAKKSKLLDLERQEKDLEELSYHQLVNYFIHYCCIISLSWT